MTVEILFLCSEKHIRWDPMNSRIDYWCKNCGWADCMGIEQDSGSHNPHEDLIRDDTTEKSEEYRKWFRYTSNATTHN